MSTICVLGLGYIGLPTACILAANGFNVIGVDINETVTARLSRGEVHIQEPGLKTIVRAGLSSGNLAISNIPLEADVFFIMVPTPITPDKGADLRFVEGAARSIVPLLRPGNLVVLESTVPPGTTIDYLAPLLAESGLDPYRELEIVHSPERVLPGNILTELVRNDRIIGGLTLKAATHARHIYNCFVEGEIYLTDATTAEMTKLMENTFRDVNIALANEFALIAEAIGINIWDAIRLANRHPRVNILQPGPGVGGHCIAVDPWFLVQAFPGSAQLIASARRLNDRMPLYIVEKVEALLADTSKPQIAVLGLAYKADVSDIRESPALTVIRCLLARGYAVKAYDPRTSNDAGLKVAVASLEEAINQADCILILTDHREFKQCNPHEFAPLMKHRVLIDTRNALPHLQWREAGYQVFVLGQGQRSDSPSGIVDASPSFLMEDINQI